VTPGQHIAGAVGAGGSFGPATTIAAGNGGQSSFDGMIAAGGSGAGVQALSFPAQRSPAGPGGGAFGGNILNAQGTAGCSGTSFSADGSTKFSSPANGAPGPWGGGGVASNSGVVYMNAQAPGAGAGGAYGAFSNGGIGAAGIVIIRY
jgi:hypothetical protein